MSMAISGGRGARIVAAVALDLVVLLVVVPAITVLPVISAVAWLARSEEGPTPCDGPAMAGMGLWMIIVRAVGLLYWPVAFLWRGRTVGMAAAGLGKRKKRDLANPAWRSGCAVS